jgi:hypothetical protein
MEFLNYFGSAKEKRWRPERLKLLSSFLDDATIRDQATSKQYDGPCAGFIYDRIGVRDFVALELASLLDIKVELKLERTPEEWTKLRKQVRDAAEKQLRQEKKPE